MSKRMRKMAAIAMAAAMAVSTPVAAAGSGTSGTVFSGATSGTDAHVFYKENITTVVVPTALTVAFNPQGLTVDVGNGEKSTDEVVSKAVAMVSEAVDDYKVGVSFAISATGNKIKFVNSVEDVNKGTDHNVLLQLQTANAGKIQVFSAAGSGTEKKDVSVSSGTLTVTKEQLSRASMSGAASGTGGIVSLGSGAKVNFLLGKADYKYEDIVLDGYSGTNVISGTLKSIGEASGTTLENKTYSGLTGFKFTGKLNKYAKWNEIGKDDKITITPTYSFGDMEVNNKNQITETVLSGTGGFLGREATGSLTIVDGSFWFSKTAEDGFGEGKTPEVVRINGVDVTKKATINQGWIGVTWDDYAAAAGDDLDETQLTFKGVVVIDGVSYACNYTYVAP